MTLRIQARKTVQTACSPNVGLRPRSDCLPAYSPLRTSQVKGQIKILPAAAMHAQGHVGKARAVVALGRELEAYPSRKLTEHEWPTSGRWQYASLRTRTASIHVVGLSRATIECGRPSMDARPTIHRNWRTFTPCIIGSTTRGETHLEQGSSHPRSALDSCVPGETRARLPAWLAPTRRLQQRDFGFE